MCRDWGVELRASRPAQISGRPCLPPTWPHRHACLCAGVQACSEVVNIMCYIHSIGMHALRRFPHAQSTVHPCSWLQGGDDDSKFDEFLGNDGGVLAGTGAYDDEDREADAVWDQVEDRMDERRRVRAGGWGGEGRGLIQGLPPDATPLAPPPRRYPPRGPPARAFLPL